MGYEHRISIFRSGDSQAVRIPKEFELPGTEATIRREGNRLVIEPADSRPDSLGEWLATLEPLGPDDRIPEIADDQAEPVAL